MFTKMFWFNITFFEKNRSIILRFGGIYIFVSKKKYIEPKNLPIFTPILGCEKDENIVTAILRNMFLNYYRIIKNCMSYITFLNT